MLNCNKAGASVPEPHALSVPMATPDLRVGICVRVIPTYYPRWLHRWSGCLHGHTSLKWSPGRGYLQEVNSNYQHLRTPPAPRSPHLW